MEQKDPVQSGLNKMWELLGVKVPDQDNVSLDIIDPFPAVREPEAGTDFLPPEYREPATPRRTRDLLDVLEEIAQNTRHLADNDPGVIWDTQARQLPAGIGEISIRGLYPVPYIYIPNVPRNMAIYTGASRGLFLASLSEGQSINVGLPTAVNSVYIEYDEGDDGDQVLVYFSSKKLDIDINPAGAVWG